MLVNKIMKQFSKDNMPNRRNVFIAYSKVNDSKKGHSYRCKHNI